MTLKNDPVFASTVVSVVLHLVLVLALLQLPAMPTPPGNGLRIELLRALAVPGQTDTAMPEQGIPQPQSPAADQVQPFDDSLKSRSADTDSAPSIARAQPQAATRHALAGGSAQADGADVQTLDVDADMRTAAMLDLLHDEISYHKRYPYLARRQRREGTARVEFMLHPDGRIDNTKLLESSRSPALDHAALSAVEAISPFEPASQYLSQVQSFRIDVVFRLQ